MNSFPTFLWRVTSAHVISYFLLGLFAYQFSNYKVLFETEPYVSFMKPMNSVGVAAGPSLQLIRGLIFSLALWPFKAVFLAPKYGWLKLWGLLIGLSILSTTAAGSGSIEGFIYTTIPIRKQLVGYVEVLPQTLLFSLIVFYWYQKPKKAWNILSICFVGIILLFGILAVFQAQGKL